MDGVNEHNPNILFQEVCRILRFTSSEFWYDVWKYYVSIGWNVYATKTFL